MTLKSQAVLFRTSSHSAQLELELTRRNIPFVKYGGLKFLEAAHIKDVLAVLRWAENPRSRMAGFRVALILPGIGPATASKIMDAMDLAQDPLAAMREIRVPGAATAEWSNFLNLFATLRQRNAHWPAEVESVVAWYEDHLIRRHDDAAVRMGDLIQLQRIAATFGSRERFLTEVTLDPPEATSDEAGVPYRDEDYLILSTIHSAKGQEWKAVSVLNVVDGCIPSDMATGSAAEIEEERRLLYVAVTRARDQLQLLVPQRFYVHQQASGGDRHVYATRSRFITNEVARLFESRTWPLTTHGQEEPSSAEAAIRIDIAARMTAMWK